MEIKKMRNLLLCTIIILMTSIAGCTGISKAYVEADLQTYQAIAPEYFDYVTNDQELNEYQKELRKDTIQSWGQRIERHLESQLPTGYKPVACK